MGWHKTGEECDITEMVGKTATGVVNTAYDELVFTTSDGTIYKFYHENDCCESVGIDDICGELDDLVGVPLLIAEDVSSEAPDTPKDQYDDSYTWTFYKFGTIKGHVTVKWYGTSNGYYSESVDLVRIPPQE